MSYGSEESELKTFTVESNDKWEKLPSYSHEVKEPISVFYGTGIIWKSSNGCVLMSIKKGRRTVHVSITSWAGVAFCAQHYYATLRISGVDHVYLFSTKKEEEYGYYKGTTFSGIMNGIPRQAESHDLDVTAPAKKNMYSDRLDGSRTLDAREGEPTHLFETPEEAIDAADAEIKRLFPQDDHRNSWEIKYECTIEDWDPVKVKKLWKKERRTRI